MAPALSSRVFSLSPLLNSLPAASRSPALTQCSSCFFSTTAAPQAKSKRRMNKHLDPYRAEQAKQRRAANLTRQAAIRKESASLGDPIRSRPTPFIDSLQPSAPLESLQTETLNHYIKKDEIQHTLERSKWLTEPLTSSGSSESETKTLQQLQAQYDSANEGLAKADLDPARREELVTQKKEAEAALGRVKEEQERRRQHQSQHDNAAEAMARIVDLTMGSGKDRTRLNIQRCIEEFGRHNTDKYLEPKPASTQAEPREATDVPVRSGPDTGSSEVQIAILTAKINVLVNHVRNKDKHNKRNLRLLVHRRQKLLSYLRRKERGGPRWQNIVDKLGINDAMWKGEISLS
ncbi:hypothetical protein DV735_g5029, partial [Chaetothyriales sp. CBS 134920]